LESKKEKNMQRKRIWMPVLIGVIVSAAAYVGNLMATPSSGFTATTLAVGRFGDIDVSNLEFTNGENGKPWHSFQKTKGPSDVFVQSNVWAPGGTSGWHTHPGHSLIIVTAGTVTAYEGDDPTCTPRVYTPGMGFVDEGGDHVHMLRNEGSVEARTIAVQLIPAGATRRIDAAGSEACSF
jgi:quercetin dioxygenase-like cupin family protein